MPGLNGWRSSSDWRQRYSDHFITAHDDAGVREQALAVGAAGYLRKPFNDEILIQAVRFRDRSGSWP